MMLVQWYRYAESDANKGEKNDECTEVANDNFMKIVLSLSLNWKEGEDWTDLTQQRQPAWLMWFNISI